MQLERTSSESGEVAVPQSTAPQSTIPQSAAPQSTSARSTPPSVGEIVGVAAEILVGAGIPEAAAEARDIVAALANAPRFWPTIARAEAASEDLASAVIDAARKRARGAPFAYSVGRAAFRYLDLHVNESVLIPRQETEVLVDLVLAATRATRGGEVADVGTGSGAIALALASEADFDRVIATDLSADALAVARGNASRLSAALKCPVDFRQGDLLAPVAGPLRAVVCNPPYIAFDERHELPPSVRNWEPTLALLSEDNGLYCTTQVVRQAARRLEAGGLLALEVDARRAAAVAHLIAVTGDFEGIRVELDLTGRERFVLATRGE